MGRPKKNPVVEEATKESVVCDTTNVSNESNDPPINGGNWSSTTPVVPMTYMHVEIMWTEKALGTSPNNKELLTDYIASQAPDAKSMQEEIDAFGEEEVLNKQLNVYPKGEFSYDPEVRRYYDVLDRRVDPKEYENLDKVQDVPYYYNYQIRGFFKDSCGLMQKAEAKDEEGKKTKTTESGKLTSYKKVIDGGIFVFPRRIAIDIPEYYLDDDGITMIPSRDENGKLRVVQRSLRTSGPSGERVAIAASEMIPAGSTMKFTIGMTSPKFKPAIIEWLNYACVHGISGWRNSGLGTCVWREIKSDYTPYVKE